jgi:hypothetical protein
MKRRILPTLFALVVLAAARAAEPSATPTRETLAADIRQLELDIGALNDQLSMVPTREIALRQPLERQLREKQQALFSKQRALSALPASPGDAATAPRPPAKLAKLFKEGKADEAAARWKEWLGSKEGPKAQGPADLRLLAAQVAAQASEDPKARERVVQKLLDASPKPAGD